MVFIVGPNGGKTFQSEGIRKAKDGGKSAGWGIQHQTAWMKLEFWAVEEGGVTRDGPEERSRGQPMIHFGCHPKEFRLHSACSRGDQQMKRVIFQGGEMRGQEVQLRCLCSGDFL